MGGRHFLIALRRAAREKSYVAVNVVTLALGLASFILITTYLRSELTYDRHHPDHERIYRIVGEYSGPGGETHSAVTSPVLGPLLVKEFPQLGTQVRILRAPPEALLQYGAREKAWDRLFIADPAVFEVFRHEVVRGDPRTALNDPFSLAISEKLARYYFDDEDPMGKTFSVIGFAFKVTLVYADPPANSHLRYDALFSTGFVNLVMRDFNETPVARLWSREFGPYTYVKVPPEFDVSGFPGLMRAFIAKYMSEPPPSQAGVRFNARLQPVADVHFGEKLELDHPTGNIAYVWGFSGIAVFLLLTGCINYMNLATARAARRSREVGIRKVMGASRAELVRQFLSESFLYTLVAMAVALMLVEVALPLTPVAELTGNDQLKVLSAEPDIVVGLVLLVIAVALIAGLYPALYLSALSANAAFLHERGSWRTGFTLRQMLVAVQLTLAIGVVTCVGIMMTQMSFLDEKPLGFEKRHRLIVQMIGADAARQLRLIQEELRGIPEVKGASRISGFPMSIAISARAMVENTNGAMEATHVVPFQADSDILRALGLEMALGRAFSRDTPTDFDDAALVNEALVRRMDGSIRSAGRYRWARTRRGEWSVS